MPEAMPTPGFQWLRTGVVTRHETEIQICMQRMVLLNISFSYAVFDRGSNFSLETSVVDQATIQLSSAACLKRLQVGLRHLGL